MLAEILHSSCNFVSVTVKITNKGNLVILAVLHLECQRVIMADLSLDFILALFVTSLSFNGFTSFYSQLLNYQWIECAAHFIVTLPDSSFGLRGLSISYSLSE